MKSYCRSKSRGFSKPAAYIHVLHGLTAGAFDQIVNGRNDNHAARTFVRRDSDIAKIGVLHVMQRRENAFLLQTNKGLVFITFLISGKNLPLFDAFARNRVDRGKDPTLKRQKMRDKDKFHF